MTLLKLYITYIIIIDYSQFFLKKYFLQAEVYYEHLNLEVILAAF